METMHPCTNKARLQPEKPIRRDQTIDNHLSGEASLGEGHAASSSSPTSDLSEGGGVGRLSAGSSGSTSNALAWKLQGTGKAGGGLPSRIRIGLGGRGK